MQLKAENYNWQQNTGHPRAILYNKKEDRYHDIEAQVIQDYTIIIHNTDAEITRNSKATTMTKNRQTSSRILLL